MTTSSSDGAPEGALVASRPLCECHGVPCYPNGVTHGKRRWRCSVKTKEQQLLVRSLNPIPNRERVKKWVKENPEKRKQHAREFRRRQLGWYTEGGMASQATKFKEIT